MKTIMNTNMALDYALIEHIATINAWFDSIELIDGKLPKSINADEYQANMEMLRDLKLLRTRLNVKC